MNSIKTHDDAIQFLERFYQFFDALVWKIDLNLTASRHTRLVTVTLGARDASLGANSEWVNVTIYLANVSEFCIKEEAQSQIQVLSSGVKIDRHSESLILDFDPYTDAPMYMEDIQHSNLYFVCKSIEWEHSDYNENP